MGGCGIGGSAAFNAVILTFVFSVYLTDAVGDDLPGTISATTWLSWALGIAGFFIAILAPITGQRFDASGKRKLSLAILTGITVLSMAGLYFVEDNYRYLWLGLVLLAIGSVIFELAGVPYNAMMRQVSTPENLGRVSGFGWAMGYFGGIVLLLLCYFGFIVGDGDTRGIPGIDHRRRHEHPDGGTAGCSVVRGLRNSGVLQGSRVAQPPAVDPGASKAGFLDSYRVLWRDLRELWNVDRRTIWYLIASALFRDGLAGVFTFGGRAGCQRLRNQRCRRPTVRCRGQRDFRNRCIGGRTLRRSDRTETGHHRLAGVDDRGRRDPDRGVRAGDVLDLRSRALPLRRARSVVGTNLPGAHHPAWA